MEIEVLIRALSDPDSGNRADAAEALGRAGAEASAAVPALIAALGDTSFLVRLLSVKALGAIGVAAAPAGPALAAACAADADLRVHALAALGEIRDASPAATDALRAALHDDDAAAREAAATALLRAKGEVESAVPVLAAIAEGAVSADGLTRALAACHLGESGAAAAVPALAAALGDADPQVREHAASALGKLGPAAQAALHALERALDDREHDGVRFAAATSIARLAPTNARAIDTLASFLDPDREHHITDAEGVVTRPSDPAIRARAATILGEIGTPARAALQPLWSLLDDPYEEVRAAARQAITRINSRS